MLEVTDLEFRFNKLLSVLVDKKALSQEETDKIQRHMFEGVVSDEKFRRITR